MPSQDSGSRDVLSRNNSVHSAINTDLTVYFSVNGEVLHESTDTKSQLIIIIGFYPGTAGSWQKVSRLVSPIYLEVTFYYFSSNNNRGRIKATRPIKHKYISTFSFINDNFNAMIFKSKQIGQLL